MCVSISFVDIFWFMLQAALQKFFPSHNDILFKHKEVVLFTCGLMSNPNPLVGHVYQIHREEQVLEEIRKGDHPAFSFDILEKYSVLYMYRSLFESLYHESAVKLPGQSLHNPHINWMIAKRGPEIHSLSTHQVTCMCLQA